MPEEEKVRLLHDTSESDNDDRITEVPSTSMPTRKEKIGVSTLTLVSGDGDSKYGPSRKITQYIAALAVTMGAFSAGTVLGWSSPADAPLKNGGFGFDLTAEQISWVGSLVCIGAAVICGPIGMLMDRIGRKPTMLLLIVPFTVGWGLIYWANSPAMLIAGRFFTGLAGGAFCVTAPLYTSEIAQKEIRGTLGSYFQLLLTVGIFFVYTEGTYVTISTLSLTCLCLPFLFVLAFVFQPETPFYYVKKGKIEEARNSLRYFRGPEYNVDLEIQEMIEANQESNSTNLSAIEILRTSRAAKKAVLISFGLMLFQQLSGVNAVIFYSGDIFKQAKVPFTANEATMIVGAMQVIATFISSLVIDRLGRRILLIASDFVMAICSVALGVYFNLAESTQANVSWLPVVSLSVFIILFSFGFGPIPWMMVGEVVPKEIRSSLTSIACTFNWILAFLVTKFYSTLSDAVGAHVTFYSFAVISFIGTVFVIFIVPETKGKTLEEIQRELSGDTTNNLNRGPYVNEAYTRNEA